MNRMMLDIETMSTHESKALVLSVGVVVFDLKPESPVIKHEGLWILNVNEQLVRGREVSLKTQHWWMEQSNAAKELWVTMQQNRVQHVLEQIALRYEGRWGHPEAPLEGRCEEIWANGTVFDIGNMNHLYLDFEVEVPWRYNQVRDMRTIVRVNPEHQKPTATMECERTDRIPHHPLADCRNQIDKLWQHWDFIHS